MTSSGTATPGDAQRGMLRLNSMSKRAAAIAYAQMGWYVLPLHTVRQRLCSCGKDQKTCRSPGKHPFTVLAPNGKDDATNDVPTVMRWWDEHPDMNIGIACDRSGFFVLDVDSGSNRQSPKLEPAEWPAYASGDAPLPKFLIQQTASHSAANPAHHYLLSATSVNGTGFAGNIGVNTAERPGDGIAGTTIKHNGYIVASPSTINNDRYVWTTDDLFGEPDEIVKSYTVRVGHSSSSYMLPGDPNAEGYKPARVDIAAWLRNAQNVDASADVTQRNYLLRGIGWLFNMGRTPEEVIALARMVMKNLPTLDPARPWEDDDLWQIVNSCIKWRVEYREIPWDFVEGLEERPSEEELAEVEKELRRRKIRKLVDDIEAASARNEVDTADRRVTGEAIFDEPEDTPCLWGSGDQILWSCGEAVMLASQQGVGKTTIAQQLILHLIGVRSDDFLGHPVRRLPEESKVLYLALDRPHQAMRSLRRMVDKSALDVLRERLVIWRGPLPFNILASTTGFADFVQEQCPGCAVVVVDSVKDLAPGISKDEVGAALNLAWQEVIARDIDMMLLHHERKASNGEHRHHKLDDIYGSTWLTSGLGSVFALEGEPGDGNIEMKHLKQPVMEVGPLSVRHNHATGTSVIFEENTGLRYVMYQAGAVRPEAGVTAASLARRMLCGDSEPLERDVKRIQRKLDKLLKLDTPLVAKVSRTKDAEGKLGSNTYYLTAAAIWAHQQDEPDNDFGM